MNFLVICEVEKLRGIDRGREKFKFENYKMRHGMAWRERESPENDSSGKFIVMIFFMLLPSLAIIIIVEP